MEQSFAQARDLKELELTPTPGDTAKKNRDFEGCKGQMSQQKTPDLNEHSEQNSADPRRAAGSITDTDIRKEVLGGEY
jgi:hypothetical protein